MIDKRVSSLAEAVAGIEDGSTVLVSGFGEVGVPNDLIDALVSQGAADSPSSPTMPAPANGAWRPC